MSLIRRWVLAACFAVALGGAREAEAGGFMERICESVVATAAQEYGLPPLDGAQAVRPAPRRRCPPPVVKSSQGAYPKTKAGQATVRLLRLFANP